jgi:hypothetical protein
MHITEQTDTHLTVHHGTAWLLPVFAVCTLFSGALTAFATFQLGFLSELPVYSLVAFLGFAWGLAGTRLVTLTVDGAAQKIRWRVRGLIPSSAELDFSQVDQIVLENQEDRNGIPYHRVVVAMHGGEGMPVVRSRTRDLHACMSVIDGINHILGRETVGGLLEAGKDEEAVRVLGNRYGVDEKRARSYVDWRVRRRDADPADACELPEAH